MNNYIMQKIRMINYLKISKISFSFLLNLVIYMGFAEANEGLMVEIATGSVTGVYYPTGGVVCRTLQRSDAIESCAVRSTDGALSNIKLVLDQQVNLAITQSNIFDKGKGPEILNKDEQEKIRSLFNLHTDVFVILVRANSGIKNLNDIKGRAVNIGPSGSGTKYNLEHIMALKGWSYKDFAQILELKASEQAESLCNNQIDVAIYTIGNPSQAIKHATLNCPTKLISLNDPEIEASFKENKTYIEAYIPGGLYKGNKENIKTFGVQAVLITNVEYDEEYIYQIVKNFFENIEFFKVQHSAFEKLDPKEMIKVEAIPLHPGALKYYKEKGWI